MRIDLLLLLKYVGRNPFHISKNFLIEKGEEDVYVYGETPLTTLDKIAHAFKISSTDILYELGCGRGRGCFWFSSFIGCQVVGIDYIPEFIQTAQILKNKFSEKEKVHFRCEDILKANYEKASVIYLYGTCYESIFIKKLIKRFSKLKKSTKIITVSYALNEYCERPLFETVKKIECQYTWGKAEVYLQIVL
jgi:SAM-dependent methyltransferase